MMKCTKKRFDRCQKTLANIMFAFFFLSAVTNAHALDGNAFANRFSDAFVSQVKVSIDGIKQSENSIVLKNVTIHGDVLSPDTRLGDVVATNVVETEHGGFSASTISIAKMSYLYEGSIIKVNKVILNDVVLPPNKGIYNQNIGFRYSSGSFGQLDLYDSRQKKLAQLEKATIKLKYSIKQNPIKFTISVPKVTVEVANFPDGSTRQDFMSMGYAKATGRIDIAGSYGGQQSIMDIERLRLVLDKGATLFVALNMDGITLDSLLKIVTLQRENGRGKIKTSSMFLGMLGQIQRYNFYGGRLRFEDQSITNKLIAVEAKRDKTTASELKNQWKTSLPGWLSFAKNTAFADAAKNAMIAFLDQPKSLEIKSEPMGRLPIIMLAISGKLSPAQLVRQLNLTIIANK